MNNSITKPYILVISVAFLVAGCSAPQLEARLEANPQCKDIINPKTGALMPCPGTDKAFYRSVGLAPAKASPSVNSSATNSPATAAPGIQTSDPVAKNPTQNDCKPQIHKKTGGTLPCPAPE